MSGAMFQLRSDFKARILYVEETIVSIIVRYTLLSAIQTPFTLPCLHSSTITSCNPIRLNYLALTDTVAVQS